MIMRVPSRIAPRLNVNSITSSVIPTEFSKSYAVAIWIAVIGIFLPPTPIEFGGATFTPARIVVCCLLIPALATLLKNGRRWVASDYFAITTAAWMIVSSVLNGGFRLYVCAEALDLLGAYLIGRAFFLGSTNLDTFSRVFRIAAIIVIALALLEYNIGTIYYFGDFWGFSRFNAGHSADEQCASRPSLFSSYFSISKLHIVRNVLRCCSSHFLLFRTYNFSSNFLCVFEFFWVCAFVVFRAFAWIRDRRRDHLL